MIFFGIDPGASGAIAAIDDAGVVVDVVKNKTTERDLWEWLSRLAGQEESVAVIEHVHSMPKQGVASSFKFGQSYGFLRGLLIASDVRFTEVTPVKWQTAMQCRSKGDKNVTKARAQQLFPNEKIIHATADALLLAEYMRTVIKNMWTTDRGFPALKAETHESRSTSQVRDSMSLFPVEEDPSLLVRGQSP